MERRGFHNDGDELDLTSGLGSLDEPADEPEDGADPVGDAREDQDEIIDPDEAGGASGGSGGDAGSEPGPDEPDYGPGRDTIYRRETWPAYAYPKRRIRIPMAFLWAVAGLTCGLFLAAGVYAGIRAFQERAMYQNIEQVIRAQWPNRELTIRPGFHDDLTNAPYYNAPVWTNMDPVENEDGSITFAPVTSREFCKLILSMRSYMDDLMQSYTDDPGFVGWLSAEPSLDYDTITVQTQMHQSGLIDQDMATVLLRQMKVHNILYRAITNEEPEVRLVFVNNGETILTMRM